VYFDTLRVKVGSAERICVKAEAQRVNFRYVDEHTIGISLDETTMPEDVQRIVSIFAEAAEMGKKHGVGKGKNKKEAEQAAARKALERVRE
jgi:dsRNA-specific ribonuclease